MNPGLTVLCYQRLKVRCDNTLSDFAFNLNALRLYSKVLKERMSQMKATGMPPFLYGTHYSAPAYVLYWQGG